MATYKKKLLDSNGNVILPYTRSELVYHGNNRLIDVLNDLAAATGSVDYVVAKGQTTTSGVTWTWRKWNSGIAECWGFSPSVAINIGNSWGALYSNANQGAIPSYNFPFSFYGTPVVEATPIAAGNNYFIHTAVPHNLNASRTPAFNVTRGTAGSTTAQLMYVVRGLWKAFS